MSSLRAWLRRNPQPHSVQVVTEDDEIKPIKLSADARNRWKGAEDAINSIPQGRHVQCLDADGVILRSQRVVQRDSEGNEVSEAEETEKAVRKALAADRASFSAMLDRYGDRLNEAFERGAQAASTSQDKLVELVEILTTQLGYAIVNVHNVSMHVATLLQQQGANSDETPGDRMLTGVLGQAMAGMMGGGGGKTPPKQPDTNGKPHGKTGKE